MSPIITQPGSPAHVHPDEAARKRRDRLARATPGQAEAALTYLSVIDPLMFEIAMDAADLTVGEAPGAEAPVDEEPIPVCRRCGGLVGIFLDRGLQWQHFRGDGTTAGAQEIYDPGHPAEVTWRLPDEDPDEP
jgi:hypothetical protein